MFIWGYSKNVSQANGFSNLTFVLIYLAHPYVILQGSLFHPEILAYPIGAAFLFFYSRDLNSGIMVSLLLLLLCREDMGILVFLLALTLLVPDKEFRKIGIILGCLSIVLTAFEILWLIPSFHLENHSPHLWRYSHLKKILSNPIQTLINCELELFLKFFFYLLLPFCLIPVISWRWMLSNPGYSVANHFIQQRRRLHIH